MDGGGSKMTLDQILKDKPSKLSVIFFVIFLLAVFSGIIWAIYTSSEVFYKQGLLPVGIAFMGFFYFIMKIHNDKQHARSVSPLERSQLDSLFYVNPSGYRQLIDLLELLGHFNLFVFLIYFGYKTVWYYPILLFFLSFTGALIITLIVQRSFILKALTTLLQFLLMPTCGVLLWFFV